MTNGRTRGSRSGDKGSDSDTQRAEGGVTYQAKTKLAVYKRGDKIVLTKLRIPPLSEELETLFREIDENYKRKKKPTEREILEEIQAYEREKRA